MKIPSSRCFAIFSTILLILIPGGTRASESVLAASEVYRVEKHYDEASATWYYLTFVRHQDDQGNLVKLRHAQARAPQGEFVREFAERTNSILAFNASMGYLPKETAEDQEIRKPVGIQIVDGEIVQERKTRVYTLGIRENNELVAYPPGTTAQAILKDGSRDALTAFVPLISGHRPVEEGVLDVVANLRQKHPRQVIAQMENLDLVFLSCGGRGFGGEGMTAMDVIRILMEKKVKFAFNLDGGGSVSTVVDGRLITEKIDGRGTKERLRPNFLYISGR